MSLLLVLFFYIINILQKQGQQIIKELAVTKNNHKTGLQLI